MSVETFSSIEAPGEAARLAALFRRLGESEEDPETVFENLESDLIADVVQRDFDEANAARLATRNPLDDPKVSSALMQSRMLRGYGT